MIRRRNHIRRHGDFPRNLMEALTLSAGSYHAQRIILGEGKEKTGGVVLFPLFALWILPMT